MTKEKVNQIKFKILMYIDFLLILMIYKIKKYKIFNYPKFLIDNKYITYRNYFLYIKNNIKNKNFQNIYYNSDFFIVKLDESRTKLFNFYIKELFKFLKKNNIKIDISINLKNKNKKFIRRKI